MAEHAELVAEIPFVEKMNMQERLKHAKKRRAYQLKKYYQEEKKSEKWQSKSRKKSTTPSNKKITNNNKRKRSTKGIGFEGHVMLLEAAARNDIEEVRRLLQSGISPDVTNEDGLTALHQCCIDDSEEMARLLLDYGANVNARDSELWTPLHAAATCAHIHLCALLILKGAELLAVNADGNMPYDICEDEVTLDYIENEMAKNGITQELIDETRLSTEKKMLEDLKWLLNQDGDLEFRDRNGATPLHIAAANGYAQVTEFLLDHHVSIDIEDNDTWQPVHAAACWGQPMVLELLVQNGADIEAKTKNGETPLDICEDPDFKQRIIELKDELESNRASRTEKVRNRKGHNTRSNASMGSIYSSNTSLSEKNPLRHRSQKTDASVRRSSMREKSMLSWKEAREEARFREIAVEDTDTNGDTPSPEAQESVLSPLTVPVSNIDEVNIVVNGEKESETRNSENEDEPANKKETVLNGFHDVSDSPPRQIKKETLINGNYDEENHSKDVRDSMISEKTEHKKPASEKADKKDNVEQNEFPNSSNVSEQPQDTVQPQVSSASKSKLVTGNQPTVQQSPSNRRPQIRSGSPVTVSPSPNTSNRPQVIQGSPKLNRAPAPQPPTSQSHANTDIPPHGTLLDLKRKRAEQQMQRLRDGSLGSDGSIAQTTPKIESRNGHSGSSNSIAQNSTNYSSTKSLPPSGDPPLQKFSTIGTYEIVGGEDTKMRCCVIL